MCRTTEWFIITRRDKLDFSHAATESVTRLRATFDVPENDLVPSTEMKS